MRNLNTVVFISLNTSNHLIDVHATLESAKQAWKLSYHKFFVPTFRTIPGDGTGIEVLSATNEILGYVIEKEVYNQVEHL